MDPVSTTVHGGRTSNRAWGVAPFAIETNFFHKEDLELAPPIRYPE